MRVSRRWLDLLDAGRGDEPRAAFVKRAVEKALATEGGAVEDARVSPAVLPESSRSSAPVPVGVDLAADPEARPSVPDIPGVRRGGDIWPPPEPTDF
jgi:hypothetical protein